MIHLSFCINDNYAKHLYVLLLSLFENNKQQKFTFYIISNDLIEQNSQNLSNLILKNGSFVEFHKTDLSLISKYLITTNNLTADIYNKFFIPSIVKDKTNKVIYLDTDILVNGKIEELWNINLENYLAGMAAEQYLLVYNKSNFNTKFGIDYTFNSGVILFNVTKWNESDVMSEIFEFIKNVNTDFFDQDVFNYCLKGKIKELPAKFNVQSAAYMIPKYILRRYFKEQLDEMINNPVIIHYTVTEKPWNPDSVHPLKYLYFKYLKNSIYEGTYTQKPSFKHKIINLIIKIVGLRLLYAIRQSRLFQEISLNRKMI